MLSFCMETGGIPEPKNPIKPVMELFEEIHRLEDKMTKQSEILINAMRSIIRIAGAAIKQIEDMDEADEERSKVPGPEAA